MNSDAPARRPGMPAIDGPGRLRYLRPAPNRLEWWTACLAVRLADIVLAFADDPEQSMSKALATMRLVSGMRLRRVPVDGIDWPFLVGGCGESVVLLHGYGADKDRFGSLTPFLRRRYRVVIPDLPGFGDHKAHADLDYGITDQVLRLDAFVRAVGLKRFHLFGISLGGYAAALYAARFPQKTLSLALMDPTGLTAPVPSDALRFFEQTGRNIFFYTRPEDVQILTEFLIHRPFALPARIKRYWALCGRTNMAWRQKLFNDLIDGGLSLLDDDAAKIVAPTLIFWGAQDRICHVSSAQALVRLIPDCRAYVFHACGHMPLFEYPAACRDLYGKFLQEVSANL
ncbi:MAG: alpha/beta hydrolase [Desulfobacteraceae bacterium]